MNEPTENTPVEPAFEDLDALSAELFGAKADNLEEDSDVKEETSEEGDDALETDATEEVTTDDEEEAPEPVVEKKPKNRAQERIEELNGKYRETQRRLEEAEARIAALTKPQEAKEAEPIKAAAPAAGEPTPVDLNEDGTDKYPLGEFDPKYLKDLMRFTLEEERKAAAEQEKQAAVIAAQKAEADALKESWDGKVATVQERYPDFVEKGQDLVETFSSIDATYGEYLSNVLMSLDNGAEVFYYLASNPEEADRIVKSGATKATLALGSLDARFAPEDSPTKVPAKKVSQAPPPPPVNKGSAGAKLGTVDVENLDALAAALFGRKGG